MKIDRRLATRKLSLKPNLQPVHCHGKLIAARLSICSFAGVFVPYTCGRLFLVYIAAVFGFFAGSIAQLVGAINVCFRLLLSGDWLILHTVVITMIWKELVFSSDTGIFFIKVTLLTIILLQFVCFRFDLAFLSGKSRRRVFGPLIF